MAAAVGTAVQVTLLGGAIYFFAARSARDVSHAGCECGEYRVEVLNHFFLAADHHAVATVQAPHTAAGAHVDVVDALRGEIFGTLDVVNVVRISAVDQNVARFQM